MLEAPFFPLLYLSLPGSVSSCVLCLSVFVVVSLYRSRSLSLSLPVFLLLTSDNLYGLVHLSFELHVRCLLFWPPQCACDNRTAIALTWTNCACCPYLSRRMTLDWGLQMSTWFQSLQLRFVWLLI